MVRRQARAHMRSSRLIPVLLLLLACDLMAHAAAPVGEHVSPSERTAFHRRLPLDAHSPSGATHYGPCACQHGHYPFLSAIGEAILPPPSLAPTEWALLLRSARLLRTERVIRSPPRREPHARRDVAG